MNQSVQPSNVFSELWFMVPRLPFTPRAEVHNLRSSLAEIEELLGIRKMEMHNGVAVIPVDGVLASGVSPIDRLYGFRGYEEIQQDLEAAVAASDVRGIVLSINSPGGQASGMLETATMVAVANQSKPVYAHTSTLAASAAYGIARGARAFYATPSAIVGSIGTYMVVHDVSKMFAQAGIETNLFASGKFKGAGTMGTAVTDEQKAQFQSVVNELAGQFKSFVQMRAPQVPDEAMEGQAVVAGQTGRSLNLVDSLATLAATIRDAGGA